MDGTDLACVYLLTCSHIVNTLPFGTLNRYIVPGRLYGMHSIAMQGLEGATLG